MIITAGSTPTLVIVLDAANVAVTPSSYGIANGSMIIAGTGSFTAGVGQCEITPAAGETVGNGLLVFVALDGIGNILGRLNVQTVPWDPDNVASLGLTNLDGSVGTVLTDLGTVLTDLGTVLTDLGTITSDVAGVPAALLDLAAGVETGFTVRQGLRVLAAALAGKISISGTTVTIRSISDTKNRIVCTVDGTGQRTAFTFDLS